MLDSEIDEDGVHWFREEDVEELVRNGIPKLAAQGGWLRDDRTPKGGKVTPIYWRGRTSRANGPSSPKRTLPHRVERSFQSSKALQRRPVHEHHPRSDTQPSGFSRGEEGLAVHRIRQLIGEVAQLPRRQLRAAQRAGITAELAELLATLR